MKWFSGVFKIKKGYLTQCIIHLWNSVSLNVMIANRINNLQRGLNTFMEVRSISDGMAPPWPVICL